MKIVWETIIVVWQKNLEGKRGKKRKNRLNGRGKKWQDAPYIAEK